MKKIDIRVYVDDTGTEERESIVRNELAEFYELDNLA
jgi:hypothetical protein